MSRIEPSEHFLARLDRIQIDVEPWTWPFASTHQDAINEYFCTLRQTRPALRNGRALLLRHYTIDNAVLHGVGFETDYASLIAWRDWNFPDPTVFNFFAAAAVQGTDRAFIVGEMAKHTAGGGFLYLPCGTPEPTDVGNDHAVDLLANLRREVLEEIGIGIEEFEAEPTWCMVHTFWNSGDRVYARILGHSNCADLSDIDARMPRTMRRFLEAQWTW